MTNNQEAIILEELTGLVKLVVEEEGFKTEILPNDLYFLFFKPFK